MEIAWKQIGDKLVYGIQSEPSTDDFFYRLYEIHQDTNSGLYHTVRLLNHKNIPPFSCPPLESLELAQRLVQHDCATNLNKPNNRIISIGGLEFFLATANRLNLPISLALIGIHEWRDEFGNPQDSRSYIPSEVINIFEIYMRKTLGNHVFLGRIAFEYFCVPILGQGISVQQEKIISLDGETPLSMEGQSITFVIIAGISKIASPVDDIFTLIHSAELDHYVKRIQWENQNRSRNDI